MLLCENQLPLDLVPEAVLVLPSPDGVVEPGVGFRQPSPSLQLPLRQEVPSCQGGWVGQQGCKRTGSDPPKPRWGRTGATCRPSRPTGPALRWHALQCEPGLGREIRPPIQSPGPGAAAGTGAQTFGVWGRGFWCTGCEMQANGLSVKGLLGVSLAAGGKIRSCTTTSR
jgi:hypothetical protein